MTWFLLTLACIILWSVTDILLKASMRQDDSLSPHKAFIWVGIVMALAGGVMSTWSSTLLDSIKMISGDVLYLIPLAFVYAAALFVGLLGVKHLEASVVSVLENLEGAIVAIVVYFYFLLTGFIHPSYTFNAIDLIATAAVIAGIILLGGHEQTMLKQEGHLTVDKQKHRYGAFALFFPILYTFADVFSVAEISGVSGNTGIVTEGVEAAIPAIDFFIFECAGFAFTAICMWLYLAIAKKYKYNPFDQSELVRCGAATGETFGTMTFIMAASINPVLTAPVTSSYCVVTIILARIFLKERLTKKQYISLGILLFGIVLLGVSEIVKAL